MKQSYRLCLALGLLLPAAPARAQFLWQQAVGTAANDETADLMVRPGRPGPGVYLLWVGGAQSRSTQTLRVEKQ